LEILRKAATSGYAGKPLDFDLQVFNEPPNPDQISTILSYLKSGSVAPLISAHPSGTTGSPSSDILASLAKTNPKIMKWPIAVNWDDGEVAVGDADGVTKMLENLRKKRDGA
jgi:hypothetical protein